MLQTTETNEALSARVLFALVAGLGVIGGAGDIATDILGFARTGEPNESVASLLEGQEDSIKDMQPEMIDRMNSPEFKSMITASLQMFEANAKFSEQVRGCLCADTDVDWQMGIMGLRSSYAKMLAEATTW